jgi:hypothetical protein
MPTFKGFTKDDKGQTLAVVDFPDARKFKLGIVNGAPQSIATPNPHEEQLTEAQFRGKFKAGFEVLPATYPDGGFSLDAIAAAAEGKGPVQKGPVMAPGGQNNNM